MSGSNCLPSARAGELVGAMRGEIEQIPVHIRPPALPESPRGRKRKQMWPGRWVWCKERCTEIRGRRFFLGTDSSRALPLTPCIALDPSLSFSISPHAKQVVRIGWSLRLLPSLISRDRKVQLSLCDGRVETGTLSPELSDHMLCIFDLEAERGRARISFPPMIS